MPPPNVFRMAKCAISVDGSFGEVVGAASGWNIDQFMLIPEELPNGAHRLSVRPNLASGEVNSGRASDMGSVPG